MADDVDTSAPRPRCAGSQWTTPIIGAERVTRLLANVGRNADPGAHVRLRDVSGQRRWCSTPTVCSRTWSCSTIADGAFQTVS